jgi:Ca2+-binding RTX toxin-like protein
MGRGQVVSLATGNDTIWGFENIVTGSGNDTITASGAVNVMDGGAGQDVFRFLSGADADGDTILGFAVGDRIDLSMADANACVAGNQSFELVTGEAFTARGQLMVSHEAREDGDYTIVHLNTTGGAEADYKFAIKGSHNLSESDFTL